MLSKRLYGLLMATSCALVIISNFAAAKISPFIIGGLPVDCGIYLFPLSFLVMDIFNDRFGLREANFATVVTLVLNVVAILYLALVVKLPVYNGWTGQAAFESVFASTTRIVLASILAYLAHFLDNVIFDRMRNGGKGFFSSSIVSTVFAQVIDSFVFEFVAFYGVLETRDFFAQFGFALFAAIVVELVLTSLLSIVRRFTAGKDENAKGSHELPSSR